MDTGNSFEHLFVGRFSEHSVAHVLDMIAEKPNEREKPVSGDLTGQYDFWFDGGACVEVTGYTKYDFANGTEAIVEFLPGRWSVDITFADGRRVYVSQSPPSPTADLSPYREKNPLLMIFAPFADEARYKWMLGELDRHSDAVRERGLQVFRILERGDNWQGDTQMHISLAAALRRRYSVFDGQFLVVLVGKDGFLRYRGDSEVAVEEILARLSN